MEKYVHKGDKLYIEGQLRTRSWDDRNGVKRYTTEVWADNMEMLSAPRTAQPAQAPAAQAPAAQPAAQNGENDAPF